MKYVLPLCAALTFAAADMARAGSNVPVLEIVTFRTVDGTDTEQFLNTARTTEALLRERGSLIRRFLTVDENGVWTLAETPPMPPHEPHRCTADAQGRFTFQLERVRGAVYQSVKRAMLRLEREVTSRALSTLSMADGRTYKRKSRMDRRNISNGRIRALRKP